LACIPVLIYTPKDDNFSTAVEKLENNKLAQDSVAQAGDQVKKMIEVQQRTTE